MAKRIYETPDAHPVDKDAALEEIFPGRPRTLNSNGEFTVELDKAITPEQKSSAEAVLGKTISEKVG